MGQALSCQDGDIHPAHHCCCEAQEDIYVTQQGADVTGTSHVSVSWISHNSSGDTRSLPSEETKTVPARRRPELFDGVSLGEHRESHRSPESIAPHMQQAAHLQNQWRSQHHKHNAQHNPFQHQMRCPEIHQHVPLYSQRQSQSREQRQFALDSPTCAHPFPSGCGETSSRSFCTSLVRGVPRSCSISPERSVQHISLVPSGRHCFSPERSVLEEASLRGNYTGISSCANSWRTQPSHCRPLFAGAMCNAASPVLQALTVCSPEVTSTSPIVEAASVYSETPQQDRIIADGRSVPSARPGSMYIEPPQSDLRYDDGFAVPVKPRSAGNRTVAAGVEWTWGSVATLPPASSSVLPRIRLPSRAREPSPVPTNSTPRARSVVPSPRPRSREKLRSQSHAQTVSAPAGTSAPRKDGRPITAR